MIREQDVVVFQGCGDERSALGPSISHPVRLMCGRTIDNGNILWQYRVMNDLNKILPLTTVEDVLASLRELVRLARQREVWTQADLARRSGVPMTTISRLERTGLASTDTLFKVLFALNRLEAVEDMLKEQLRLVKFPKTLDGDFESAPKVVKRVRHKGGSK